MITEAFLREHFRKHDFITLYKPDGTPVSFSKQDNFVLCGGYSRFTFQDYEELMKFYKKHDLHLEPVINNG